MGYNIGTELWYRAFRKGFRFYIKGHISATEAQYKRLYGSYRAQSSFPEYYQKFVDYLPGKLQNFSLAGYHQVLHSSNEVAVISASTARALCELRLSTIEHHHIGMAQVEDAHQALCMEKISSHYFTQKLFY
jgi:proline iminopeptidase